MIKMYKDESRLNQISWVRVNLRKIIRNWKEENRVSSFYQDCTINANSKRRILPKQALSLKELKLKQN